MTLPNWIRKIIEFMTSKQFKGAVSLVAAVVMYFTPDDVDRIIMTVLGLLGFSQLIIVPAPDKQDGSDETV